MIRLLPILLLTGVLMLHDASPASHPHSPDLLEKGPSAAPHHPGHVEVASQGDESEAGLGVETCGTVRIGAAGNESGDAQANDGHAMSLPELSTMDAFGAVCPPRIGHPPGNPPQTLRAFLRVYRI